MPATPRAIPSQRQRRMLDPEPAAPWPRTGKWALQGFLLKRPRYSGASHGVAGGPGLGKGVARGGGPKRARGTCRARAAQPPSRALLPRPPLHLRFPTPPAAPGCGAGGQRPLDGLGSGGRGWGSRSRRAGAGAGGVAERRARRPMAA